MNLRHITLLALLFCATTTMYAQENDVDENEVGFTEERPNYGQGFHAHRYALQRPNIAKRFEKKVLGDRLFFDFGVGVTLPFSASENSKNGFISGVSVGDWLTPEHGVRAGIKVGNYTYGNYDITVKGLSLDYLLNFSALTTYGKTYEKKKFELLGVAGLDILHRSHGSSSSLGLGVHIGARAQYGIPNSIFQIYAEPRLYFMDAREQTAYTTNMYKSGAEMLFGLSILPYQRVIPTGNQADLDDDGHFLNNTFVYFAGGPQALLSPLKGSMTNTLGARMQGGIGKWFKRGFGARLSAYANFLGEKDEKKNKGLGFSADAMVDLTYLNEGYNPHRRFWMNALLGASLALHKHEGVRKTFTYGFGAGLQPNFRLTEGIAFFLEPRVDVFNNKNDIYGSTTNSWAVVPSLLAGVNFMQGGFTKEQRATNANFANVTPYDHLFIDGAAGVYFAGETYRTLWDAPAKDAHLKFYGAIGKWFNATSGMRIWADVNKPRAGHYADHQLTAGIDYLWNMTNTFHGYDPNRKVELHSSLGFNVLKQKNIDGFAYGVNAGVRAQWNATKMVAFFVEPQVRVYKEDLWRNNYTTMGYDFVPVGLLGMQLRFDGYTPANEKDAFVERKYGHYFSVAGGLQALLRKRGESECYGPIARLTYGKQFTPLSSYRLHGLVSGNEIYGRKYANVGVGADYMVDLTAMAYGYNEDRKFTLSSILGATANVSYQSGSKFQFYPEVYAGAQAAVRISDRYTFFYEPQLRYDFTNQMKHAWGTNKMTTSQRLSMVHLLGMQLRFDGYTPANEKDAFMERNYGHYFGVAGGVQALLHKRGESECYGPIARLTYGKQFSPISSYRLHGLASANEIYGRKYANVGVGADYMVDLTAIAFGYNEDRKFTLSGILGATANVSYQSGAKFQFYPEVYTGAQAAVRISDRFTLFYEPQLSYDFTNRMKHAWDTYKTTTSQRLSMVHLLGMQLRFDEYTHADENDSYMERDYDHYFGVAGGVHALLRKYKVGDVYGPIARLTYGKQFSPISSYRLHGLVSANEINNKRHASVGVGADYMIDLSTIAYGYNEDRKFTLSGLLGATANVSYQTGAKVNFYPEVYAGAQAAVRISDRFTLFYEPQVRYDFSNQMKNIWDTYELTKSQRLSMVHLLGMNMKFEAFKKSREERGSYDDEEKHEFMSLTGGLNVPLRRLNIARFYGPTARFSYGKQFNPFLLYRFNLGMEYNNFNWGRERRSVPEEYHYFRASLGADIMLDYTSWAYGYNPDRRFILRPYVGVAASVARVDDRWVNKDAKYHYYPDLMAGAQASLRVSKNIELFYEGQMKYSFSDQIGWVFDTNETSTLQRLTMSHMLGMNYRFSPVVRNYRENAGYSRPHKQFVSVSAGANLNSATSFNIRPRGDKWGFSIAARYGRWMNGVTAYQFGIDNTQINTEYGSQHWTTLHADLLCDLRTLLTNDVHEGKLMTCNAFAGVGLGISRMENRDEKFAPMLHAGFQIGANIGERFNVYIEPSGQLFEKGISQSKNGHPLEVTGKIMLGTKYNF